MRCRYCKGELLHYYSSAYKCDNCQRVFDMFEEESFEDLKIQVERESEKIIKERNLLLRKRTDAEFMTDENEPSAEEERLAFIEKELLDISREIGNLEDDISVLEDEYEELMLEAIELRSYQER